MKIMFTRPNVFQSPYDFLSTQKEIVFPLVLLLLYGKQQCLTAWLNLWKSLGTTSVVNYPTTNARAAFP